MHSLTDMDIIELVKFSYMDLSDKKDYLGYTKDVGFLIAYEAKIGELNTFLGGSTSVGGSAFYKVFESKDDSTSRFDFQKILTQIKQNSNLNQLVLIGHINDDVRSGNENGTGLVAYAFKNNARNEIYFLCRGSEGGMLSFVPDWVDKIKKKKWTEIFKSEDWQDNFDMIYKESSNFKPLKKFADEIRRKYEGQDMKYSVFGHSKGGGLAIYLAAIFEDMSGAAVDGVGLPLSTYIENVDFIKILKKSNIRNIIAENDIVGRMLVHFEKREYVKMNESFINEKDKTVKPGDTYAFAWAHYPDAIFIGTNEMVIESRKKRFLPTAVSIINNMLMLKLLQDRLSGTHKKDSEIIIRDLEEKSIAMLDTISNL